MRKFIPSFAKILMDITDMLRKDHEIKWTIGAKKSFKDIKQAISKAPVLINPYFEKHGPKSLKLSPPRMSLKI